MSRAYCTPLSQNINTVRIVMFNLNGTYVSGQIRFDGNEGILDSHPSVESPNGRAVPGAGFLLAVRHVHFEDHDLGAVRAPRPSPHSRIAVVTFCATRKKEEKKNKSGNELTKNVFCLPRGFDRRYRGPIYDTLSKKYKCTCIMTFLVVLVG